MSEESSGVEEGSVSKVGLVEERVAERPDAHATLPHLPHHRKPTVDGNLRGFHGWLGGVVGLRGGRGVARAHPLQIFPGIIIR